LTQLHILYVDYHSQANHIKLELPFHSEDNEYWACQIIKPVCG